MLRTPTIPRLDTQAYLGTPQAPTYTCRIMQLLDLGGGGGVKASTAARQALARSALGLGFEVGVGVAMSVSASVASGRSTELKSLDLENVDVEARNLRHTSFFFFPRA